MHGVHVDLISGRYRIPSISSHAIKSNRERYAWFYRFGIEALEFRVLSNRRWGNIRDWKYGTWRGGQLTLNRNSRKLGWKWRSHIDRNFKFRNFVRWGHQYVIRLRSAIIGSPIWFRFNIWRGSIVYNIGGCIRSIIYQHQSWWVRGYRCNDAGRSWLGEVRYFRYESRIRHCEGWSWNC